MLPLLLVSVLLGALAGAAAAVVVVRWRLTNTIDRRIVLWRRYDRATTTSNVTVRCAHCNGVGIEHGVLYRDAGELERTVVASERVVRDQRDREDLAHDVGRRLREDLVGVIHRARTAPPSAGASS